MSLSKLYTTSVYSTSTYAQKTWQAMLRDESRGFPKVQKSMIFLGSNDILEDVDGRPLRRCTAFKVITGHRVVDIFASY